MSVAWRALPAAFDCAVATAVQLRKLNSICIQSQLSVSTRLPAWALIQLHARLHGELRHQLGVVRVHLPALGHRRICTPSD